MGLIKEETIGDSEVDRETLESIVVVKQFMVTFIGSSSNNIVPLMKKD